MRDTKTAMIFTYAHLPEKAKHYANPPEDITKDKYNDLVYLEYVFNKIKELKEKDFGVRTDKTLPYDKKIILNHIKNRIEFLKKGVE